MARTAGAALAAVALTGVLLAGCGLPDGGSTSPTASEAAPTPAAPSPTPTPAPVPPVAETVRAGGVAALVGDRTVLHAAAEDGGTVTATPDGDVMVLTVDGGPPGTPVAVLLAAPPDATFTLQDDGSFVVLAADGAFLGGAARPVTADRVAPVRITATDDGVVRASADDGDLELRVAASALAGAEWGEREGGRSLAVSPTPWARVAGQAGEAGVWAELVAAVPEADTAVMHDQLTCHVLGAPDKETWNLEPWRPDVGLFGILAAACNPT